MFVLNAHCPYLLYQFGVVHFIEEALYVKFYDIVQIAVLQSAISGLDGVFHTSHRAKSVAVIAEFRFADRFHDLLDTLLYQPVPHTWYSKGTHGAVRLWDFLSSYRSGAVAPFSVDDSTNPVHHFIRR